MKKLALLVILILLVGCSSIPTIQPSQLSNFVSRGATVVMFTKPACPPCDTQSSILEGLSKKFPTIRFAKVYAFNSMIVPTDIKMVHKYDIRWTPTTIFQLRNNGVYIWITLHGADQIRPILKAYTEGRVLWTTEGCKIIPKKGF